MVDLEGLTYRAEAVMAELAATRLCPNLYKRPISCLVE
ncbi:MAG: hypothetical protein LZF60_130021 [Nitrospira sp.]|nr:MAG: hypothetical protein LZF60_130021 [Nitrospira sp.]